MLNLDREIDYLTWLFGHDEEYEEKMGGDSKENKITFIKMRIIAFGAILEFLEEHYNTIKSFKGYDSLDTSDQKYPIEKQIGYCRARLYGSIKFALRHQINKEEIKKWYSRFDENEDLYHGLDYLTLYSEEEKKELLEKLKSPSTDTDRYAPAEVVDKLINNLESSVKKVPLLSCENCGKEHAPEAKFCGGCGIKIEEKKEEKKVPLLSCENCGKEHAPEAKFCGGCGTKIKEKIEKINSDNIKEGEKSKVPNSDKQESSYEIIDKEINEAGEQESSLVTIIDELYEEEYTFVKSIREKLVKGKLKNEEMLNKYILNEHKKYNFKETMSKAYKYKEIANLIDEFLNEFPDPPLPDYEDIDQHHSLAARCNLLLGSPEVLMSTLGKENNTSGISETKTIYFHQTDSKGTLSNQFEEGYEIPFFEGAPKGVEQNAQRHILYEIELPEDFDEEQDDPLIDINMECIIDIRYIEGNLEETAPDKCFILGIDVDDHMNIVADDVYSFIAFGEEGWSTIDGRLGEDDSGVSKASNSEEALIIFENYINKHAKGKKNKYS